MKSRRIVCVLACALMLVACFAGASMADEAKLATTQSFLDVLDDNGVRYTLGSVDSDGDEKVTVSYSDDDYTTIRFTFFFKKNGESAMIRVWNLLEVTAGKNYALNVVNQLNYKYRFACFYLDETDNSITCDDDVLFDKRSAGDLVYRDMKLLLQILGQDDVVELLNSIR